jgi:hypothetical protein
MRKESRDNETKIVDIEKLNRFKNKNSETDITEIVLLSGYAGLVVMWVVACCS